MRIDYLFKDSKTLHFELSSYVGKNKRKTCIPCVYFTLFDTCSFFNSEAHDIHGLHGFIIHLIILVAWNLNMASREETVLAKVFE